MTKLLTIAIVTMALCSGSLGLNPFDGITRLKNQVKSTSSDLSRYGNRLIFNARTKLNNLKFDQMQNVNTAVNNALRQIRADVDEAKKNGKDAEHCYETARLQLRDASKTAFAKLDQCVENQLAELNPVKNNIDLHITKGNLLLSELDGIAMSCVSAGNPIQVQVCVAQKLPAASASVSAYKATADQLKSTGDSISGSAPSAAIRCFQSHMSELYSATSAARIAATQCIRDAKSQEIVQEQSPNELSSPVVN